MSDSENGFLLGWIYFLVFWYGAISLFTFFAHLFITGYIYKEQDLKVKYNAKWALVTGGSTGIGRAITEKLAKQGLNVVIVALDDQHLKEFHQKIQKQYPKLQFRAVGVDLSQPGYMDAIRKATDDVPINIVFNNAGFIIVGMFTMVDLDKHMRNIEVNSMVSVRVTHHFVNRMLKEGLKGCVLFTSSPAGSIPTPFSVIYGSTKAFISSFAQSLAGEIKKEGIDVCVVHPSPVDTNFYRSDTAHKSDMLNIFRKAATTPETIAEALFANVGRAVIKDQGFTTMVFRLILKTLDLNFFADLTATFAHLAGDWKKLNAEMRQKLKKN